MLLKVIVGLLALVVVAMLFVRLAPFDSKRWHKSLEDPKDKSFAAGVVRVIPNGAPQFPDLVALMDATPRTKLKAGDVENGIVTYQTRTLYWGFPDYSTVWTDNGNLVIYARLRFGRGDYGVNEKRVEKWIAALPKP